MARFLFFGLRININSITVTSWQVLRTRGLNPLIRPMQGYIDSKSYKFKKKEHFQFGKSSKGTVFKPFTKKNVGI